MTDAYSQTSPRLETRSEKTGIDITPQTLREWFCCEFGSLGVPDRYVDAFCGRLPKTVLARRYTDYSPQRARYNDLHNHRQQAQQQQHPVCEHVMPSFTMRQGQSLLVREHMPLRDFWRQAGASGRKARLPGL
jgi:hypothetical protein